LTKTICPKTSRRKKGEKKKRGRKGRGGGKEGDRSPELLFRRLVLIRKKGGGGRGEGRKREPTLVSGCRFDEEKQRKKEGGEVF